MQVGVLLEAYTSQIVYFDTSRLWLRWNHHRRHLRWDSGNGLHFSFERPYVTIQSNVASSKIGSRHDRSNLQCTWTQIGSPLRAGPVPCNTNIQSSLNSRMRMLFVLSRLNIDCYYLVCSLSYVAHKPMMVMWLKYEGNGYVAINFSRDKWLRSVLITQYSSFLPAHDPFIERSSSVCPGFTTCSGTCVICSKFEAKLVGSLIIGPFVLM